MTVNTQWWAWAVVMCIWSFLSLKCCSTPKHAIMLLFLQSLYSPTGYQAVFTATWGGSKVSTYSYLLVTIFPWNVEIHLHWDVSACLIFCTQTNLETCMPMHHTDKVHANVDTDVCLWSVCCFLPILTGSAHRFKPEFYRLQSWCYLNKKELVSG